METVLVGSYVVHVASAALWTGATLYFVYSWYLLPYLRNNETPTDARSFVASADALLRVTRWTGIALPVTGVYLILRLYSLDALVGTTRGSPHPDYGCDWGIMNGVMETGVFRMRGLDGGGGNERVRTQRLSALICLRRRSGRRSTPGHGTPVHARRRGTLRRPPRRRGGAVERCGV